MTKQGKLVTVFRSYGAAELARNKALADALRDHGKGSPELAAVVGRQREELQDWIKKERKTA